MKIPTFISTAALLGSVVAIFLAARQPQLPAQSAIDAMVDARLAARELKLVQSFAPEFRVMFADMGEPKYGANWSPRTLEELLEPLVKVINSMGESDPSKPAPPATEPTGGRTPEAPLPSR